MYLSSYLLLFLNIIWYLLARQTNNVLDIFLYVSLFLVNGLVSLLNYFFGIKITLILAGTIIGYNYKDNDFETIFPLIVGISIGFTIGTLCEILDKNVVISYIL